MAYSPYKTPVTQQLCLQNNLSIHPAQHDKNTNKHPKRTGHLTNEDCLTVKNKSKGFESYGQLSVMEMAKANKATKILVPEAAFGQGKISHNQKHLKSSTV